MASFKISIVLISIIINIADAGLKEDIAKCNRQLVFAFGCQHDSVAACLRHAIEHYLEGQPIKVPEDTLIDDTQTFFNQPQNVDSTSQYYPGIIQHDHSNKGSSQHDPGSSSLSDLQSSEAFTEWLQNQPEFNPEIVNEYDLNDRYQNFLSTTQHDPSSSQSDFRSSQSDLLTAEGFTEWLENQPGFNPKDVYDFNYPQLYDQYLNYLSNIQYNLGPSQYNIGPSQYNVDDLEKWIEELLLIGNEEQNIMEVDYQNVATQQHMLPNYAEEYHILLKKMLSPRDVPSPKYFCDLYYIKEAQTCYLALEPFFPSSLSAVRVAFSNYTLEMCKELKKTDIKFKYIQKYMEIIIETIRSHYTTKPSKFCEWKMEEKYNIPQIPDDILFDIYIHYIPK